MSHRPKAVQPSRAYGSTASADRASALLLEAQQLHIARDWDNALATYDRALRLAPLNLNVRVPRLRCLVDSGRHTPELVAELERFTRDEPAVGHGWSCLADVHRRALQWPEAERCYRRALAYPGSPIAWLAQLAIAVAAQGRPAECIALLGDSARLKPGNALEQWNRALSRLCLGRWEEGLADYEMRERAGMLGASQRVSNAPLWLGQPLPEGATLLLAQEQGLGDSILASRYFSHAALAAGVARTVALVPPALTRLYEVSRLGVEVQSTLHEVPIEHHARLFPLSLFHVLGKGPGGELCAYLQTDRQEELGWFTWLEAVRAREFACDMPTLGFVWRGNPDQQFDKVRSLRFHEALYVVQLVRAAGWLPIILQQPLSEWERRELAEVGAVLREPGQEGDLANTGALMQALDLVLSVDSAPIHLAGALGRPALMLQGPLPEWRWAFESSSTPLYPTVRIVRARVAQAWGPVFEQLGAELQRWRATLGWASR